MPIPLPPRELMPRFSVGLVVDCPFGTTPADFIGKPFDSDGRHVGVILDAKMLSPTKIHLLASCDEETVQRVQAGGHNQVAISGKLTPRKPKEPKCP